MAGAMLDPLKQKGGTMRHTSAEPDREVCEGADKLTSILERRRTLLKDSVQMRDQKICVRL